MSTDLHGYQERTRQLALGVIALVDSLPETCSTRVIGEQLLRCATGAAANYRAATRSPSRVEMLAKLGAVEEQADLALFWLETLAEAGLAPKPDLAHLMQEFDLIISVIHVVGQAMRDSIKRGSGSDCRRKLRFEKEKRIHG
jgi:four helix bundle protein